MNPLENLPAFASNPSIVNVIIDTPKGCRNKFAWDRDKETYVLKTVLPAGSSFPFDFGSIAGTIAEDGDPVDVLVLMDEPAFVGCLVESRLIGVIEAKQTEDGKTERNDRLIAVAAESHTDRGIKKLSDLDSTLVKEIEHFFVSYNASRGKKFKPIGRYGPRRARQLVKSQRVQK